MNKKKFRDKHILVVRAGGGFADWESNHSKPSGKQASAFQFVQGKIFLSKQEMGLKQKPDSDCF